MARLLTPVAKFWICKRGSHFAQEAMECLGGNGYVEEGGEGVMARVYREMPLNSIWEGAGNIMALDLLRGAAQGRRRSLRWRTNWRRRVARMPRSTGWPTRCRRASRRWRPRPRRVAWRRTWRSRCRPRCWCRPRRRPWSARFCASRLGGDWGHAFGTLGAGVDLDAIIARARPQ